MFIAGISVKALVVIFEWLLFFKCVVELLIIVHIIQLLRLVDNRILYGTRFTRNYSRENPYEEVQYIGGSVYIILII